ncbi:MAG: NADP-dependent oxidoreductase [Actinomycetota bacterium]|nr:NADP-dependent oxidoreductase [Actinomycetota bacterium]
MATMNALTFTKGGVENLTVVSIERPEPRPTEVLVRVDAAGVNPIDWTTRDGGGVYANFDQSSPMILGWDVAGVVEEVGAGVTRFRKGERVFGMPRFPDPAGAYAEFVVAPSRQLTRIPEGVADLAAAAVPLSGLTAYQAIVDALHVGQGDRVLIHGAGGNVGQLAVQIAKARRAEVWASEVSGRQDVLTKLGVDHAINSDVDDFAELASDMNAVLDLVGTEQSSVRALRTLVDGGRLVVLSSPSDLPSEEQLAEANVTGRWMLVEPDYAGLDALAAMLSYGLLKVSLAETRPMSEIGALHEIGEAGDTPGRLVATVWD